MFCACCAADAGNGAVEEVPPVLSQEKALEQVPEPAAPKALQETPAATAEPAEETPELTANAVTFTFKLPDGSVKNINFDAKPLGMDFFKTTPLCIKAVKPNSLAEKAGILPQWVMTHTQGEPMPDDLNASIVKLSQAQALSASSCTIPSLRCNFDAMAAVFPANQVIVVGGGLAGMSAANTVVELGGRTILLDKSSFCGGNSTKATSGINGAGTKTQKGKSIPDTAEIFIADTLKGGAKKPELAKVLCANSAADVDWLVDKFDLDLSLVARLGGHSQPRTHRGKERFPGMTITYALIQMLEKVAEKTNRARIVTKAEVYKLLVNAGTVVGCEYKKAGKTVKEFGPMVLASGGFGADFGADSLLATYRPDLLHLPTTNGEHCTGDAIKMGEAIGAATIDLEWVQVHPTGLVKPDDPDAKVKFLAAEALRGVGGIVLDANGDRFCNELGRRDYVTGEMWKNKPPFRLCLNKAAADEIIWHAKHYTGRGVMKFYASGEDLAKDMGVPLQKIVDAHQKHFEAAKKQEKDPDGGPFPAYPSGKTWDEPSGKTGSGKKFFHNIIDGSKVPTEPFYVAIITPVIHYCMGGLECTVDAECIDKKSGKVIPGLYVAGEAAGGIHGNNRLGGNSLLDCVVFGRVAGKAACKFTFGAGEKFKPCPPAGELKDLCK